jgi:hypothetical protein
MSGFAKVSHASIEKHWSVKANLHFGDLMDEDSHPTSTIHFGRQQIQAGYWCPWKIFACTEETTYAICVVG